MYPTTNPCIIQVQASFLQVPGKPYNCGVKPYKMSEKATHQGRAVKRIREIMGIKQEVLASELGITQQAISQLEAKEILDSKILEDVAKVLKVPVDAIKNFNDEATVNYVANTFNGNSGNYMNFNPIDKVVELYERILKEKDAIIEELKKK